MSADWACFHVKVAGTLRLLLCDFVGDKRKNPGGRPFLTEDNHQRRKKRALRARLTCDCEF